MHQQTAARDRGAGEMDKYVHKRAAAGWLTV